MLLLLITISITVVISKDFANTGPENLK